MRRFGVVTFVVALTVSTTLLVGQGTALASCQTTAFNSWSANCITSTTDFKISRFTVAIQWVLHKQGYYTPSPDGDFGMETYDAVKAFQGANGLSQDGIVGTNTWSKLQSKLSSGGAACSGYTFYGLGGASTLFIKNNSTGEWWELTVSGTGSSGPCSTPSYVVNTSSSV